MVMYARIIKKLTTLACFSWELKGLAQAYVVIRFISDKCHKIDSSFFLSESVSLVSIRFSSLLYHCCNMPHVSKKRLQAKAASQAAAEKRRKSTGKFFFLNEIGEQYLESVGDGLNSSLNSSFGASQLSITDTEQGTVHSS